MWHCQFDLHRSRVEQPSLLHVIGSSHLELCCPSLRLPCPGLQVNRLAQKTDAGQLSRNLLLVPRATVNVKPNLQIIADDVKCTHGAAISDLSEEEMFYFRWGGLKLCSTSRTSSRHDQWG
jgi:hypothetical protein